MLQIQSLIVRRLKPLYCAVPCPYKYLSTEQQYVKPNNGLVDLEHKIVLKIEFKEERNHCERVFGDIARSR